MTTLRQAAEMALEALGKTMGVWGGTCAWHNDVEKTIDALKEALAQPEQEPVAWRIKVHKYDEETDESSFPWEYHHIRGEGQPLYLHPAPAITEGWQLVPKEPTKEMSDTFWSAYIPAPDGIAQSCSFEDFHDFRYMYKAMLDAAPKPEE